MAEYLLGCFAACLNLIYSATIHIHNFQRKIIINCYKEQYSFTVFVWVMENLESHGIEAFQFPGLESQNLIIFVGHGKSWKIIVCVVRKLLQLSKQ